MSSTNVHSEEKAYNLQLVGGQVIADAKQNKVVIPPKSAGRGPSRLEVKSGLGVEIPVIESELHKDGTLVAKDGTVEAKFDAKAYTKIAAKHKEQTTKSKKVKAKGEDR